MKKILGPHLPRQTKNDMKTVVLLCAAALCCVPCLAKEQGADERPRAIYTEEWKWRLEQFPGLEGVTKPVPDRLPKVDPATQAMRLADYMADRGLSDETVAEAIGRSRVSVSRYRRRLVRPDWEAIQRIRAFTKGKVSEEDWRAGAKPRDRERERVGARVA